MSEGIKELCFIGLLLEVTPNECRFVLLLLKILIEDTC